MHEPRPETPPAATPLPRNVKLLGWASFLNDVASETIFPLLPVLLTQIGAGALFLGLIEGVSDCVASLLKLIAGGWSDRHGTRKGWIVAGYSFPALIRPLVGLAVAPWHVLAIRITDRVGKGIRTSPRDAMIADSTDQSQHGRSFGFHRAMDHLGAALGPVLGALFLYCWPDEHRTLFLLTIVPGLAVLVLVALGLAEPPRHKQSSTPLRWSLRPFDSRFRLYLLALAIFSLGNSTDAFLVLHARQLGMAPYQAMLLWFVFHVAKSAGNVIAGGWVDRLGPRPVLVTGWLIYAGVYLLFASATQSWQIWPLFLLYSLYYSLAEPAEKAIVTRLVPYDHKGLAFGWFHATIGLAVLPASLAFGALYQQAGPWWAFVAGASLSGLATLVLLTIPIPRRPAG